MPLVTPGMLAAARNLGKKGLTDLAEVLRSTQTEDAFGSHATWATVATDVPCWVREGSLQDALISVAMREAIKNTFRIHFEVGTDIRPGDRLVISGITYDVIDNNDNNTIKVFHTITGERVI